MKEKNIVVGVDFSEASKAAIKEAAHLASARRSWLDVVHVIDQEFFERELDEKFLTAESLQTQAEEALREFALKSIKRPPSIRFKVLLGHPFKSLLDYTMAQNVDLLVLGSRGNDESDNGVGTHASRFVREAPFPLLLVRDQNRAPFKMIVACHDFSKTSQRALEYAAELACLHQAELHVLHVYVDYPHPYLWAPGEITGLPDHCYSDHIDHLSKQLGEIVDQQREKMPNLKAQAIVKRGTSGPSEIYRYVEEVGADLTVLGTRGRTGFKKLLLGTVAEKIIQKCPSSVLAIKPTEFS